MVAFWCVLGMRRRRLLWSKARCRMLLFWLTLKPRAVEDYDMMPGEVLLLVEGK
jgi:hypothetical protein